MSGFRSLESQIRASMQRIRQLQEMAQNPKIDLSGLKKLNQAIHEEAAHLQDLENRYARTMQAAGRIGETIGSAIRAVGSGIGRIGSGIINHFRNNLQRAGAATQTFGQRIYGLLRGIAVFSLLRRAFSSLVSYMREGTNAYIANDARLKNSINGLRASLNTLKGSLGSAFAPILSAVVPVLTTIANAAIKAANAVAAFMAAIMGKSSYKIAVGGLGDVAGGAGAAAGGLGDAADSAKKLKRELAGFDELNVIDIPESSGSGSGGGGGGGGGGGNGGAGGITYTDGEISDSIRDFAEKVKEAWKKADFTEIGAIIGTKLKNALDNIPWGTIQDTARKVGKSVATLINGFVEVPGLGTSIGNTLAQAFNTGLYLLEDFVFNLHFDSIGKFISDGIVGCLDNIDFASMTRSARRIGGGIAEALNEILTPKTLGSVGTALGKAVNVVIEGAYTFVTTARWDNWGTAIAEGLNRFFGTINWAKAGLTFSRAVDGILQMMINAVRGTNWEEVGHDIGEMLKNIEWGKILADVGTLIWEILKGAFSAAVGIFDEAPIQSALLAAIATLALSASLPTAIGALIGPVFSAVAPFAAAAFATAFLGDAMIKEVKEFVKNPSGYIKKTFEVTGKAPGGNKRAEEKWPGQKESFEKGVNNLFKNGGTALKNGFVKLFGNGSTISTTKGKTFGGAGKAFGTVVAKGKKAAVQAIALFTETDPSKLTPSQKMIDSEGKIVDIDDSNMTFGEKALTMWAKVLKTDTSTLKPQDTVVPSEGAVNETMVKTTSDDTVVPSTGDVNETLVSTTSKDTVIPSTGNIEEVETGEIECSIESCTAVLTKSADEIPASQKFISDVAAKFTSFADNIKTKVVDTVQAKFTSFQDAIKSKIVDTVQARFTDFKDAIKSKLVDTVQAKFTSFKDAIKSKVVEGAQAKATTFKDAIASAKKVVGGLFKGTSWRQGFGKPNINATAKFTSWVDSLRNKVISFTARVASFFGLGKATGGVYYAGSWHNIPQFASGGRPSHGTTFVAGESGPEIVGHIGGRTEVLNKSQLASTMYQAVIAGISDSVSTIVNPVTGTMVNCSTYIADTLQSVITQFQAAQTATYTMPDFMTAANRYNMLQSAQLAVAGADAGMLTGNGGSANYTFVAQLDGREIFRETVSQNQLYKNQTGHSAF